MFKKIIVGFKFNLIATKVKKFYTTMPICLSEEDLDRSIENLRKSSLDKFINNNYGELVIKTEMHNQIFRDLLTN